MKRWLAALLLLGGGFAPGELAAQPDRYAVLVGRVLDAETEEPLAGVHVFIAASMIGAVTDTAGRYRLERVPSGAHRLYVSMVGFDVATQDVRVREAATYTFDFRLEPLVLEGPEITVTAERDPRWARRLRRFERMFIGESANAAQTRMVNPEVLDFEGGWGKLYARASEPLVIENRALGYRIRYFLKEFESVGSWIRFDGEPLFEEMTPESPAEAARWETLRREAFYGSFKHFLLALLAGACREEGFVTHILPAAGRYDWSHERFPLRPDMILAPGDTTAEQVLDFPGVVEVTYLHEEESREFRAWRSSAYGSRPGQQVSWFRLNDGPAAVDAAGEVVDPYAVTVYGHFAFERVADQLPKEYRPPGDPAGRAP